MSFNLDLLNAPITRWLELTGPAEGVKVLVKYASPAEGERFRRLLLQKGIFRLNKELGIYETVDGKAEDYILEFCRYYVSDWEGVANKDGAPVSYSPENLVRILRAIRSAMETVTNSVLNEADFFKPSETRAN